MSSSRNAAHVRPAHLFEHSAGGGGDGDGDGGGDDGGGGDGDGDGGGDGDDGIAKFFDFFANCFDDGSAEKFFSM